MFKRIGEMPHKHGFELVGMRIVLCSIVQKGTEPYLCIIETATSQKEAKLVLPQSGIANCRTLYFAEIESSDNLRKRICVQL